MAETLDKYFKNVPQVLKELDDLKGSYQNEEKRLKDRRDEFLKTAEGESRSEVYSEWGMVSGAVSATYDMQVKKVIDKHLRFKWRLILPFSKRHVYDLVGKLGLEGHINSEAAHYLVAQKTG
jgi:hypothetical protein